jgi:hypothetical protein
VQGEYQTDTEFVPTSNLQTGATTHQVSISHFDTSKALAPLLSSSAVPLNFIDESPEENQEPPTDVPTTLQPIKEKKIQKG